MAKTVNSAQGAGESGFTGAFRTGESDEFHGWIGCEYFLVRKRHGDSNFGRVKVARYSFGIIVKFGDTLA